MNRLKDLREDNEKKQDEVAAYLEISQQYYSRYELDKVDMPIRHYKKLAILYNVSIDYLCGLIDYPKTLNGDTYKTKNITNIKGKIGTININNK